MKYLDLAIKIAKGGNEDRNYLIGCVGVRTDSAVVVSQNILTKKPEHTAHAESRALKKCDKGSILYVARVHRSGDWANAKPCIKCQTLIRNKEVKKVYYTLGPNEWGCWNVENEL